MKKKVLSVLLAVLMVIGLFAPMATANSVQAVPPAELADDIMLLGTLTPPTATIAFNTQLQFTAPPGTNTIWSSSNTLIADFSAPGLITGIGIGTATITADVDGTLYTASVTVQPAVTLPATFSLVAGSTGSLTPTIAPNVAATISWTSSNESFATVASASGLITAVAPGTTNIGVTVTINGISSTATTALTVTAAATPALTLTPNPLVLVAGGSTGQLTATPSNLGGGTLSAIAWTSSNPAVATVSGTGVVTPLAVGNTTITASATVGVTPVSGTANVVVDPAGSIITVPDSVRASIAIGGTRTLTATVPGVTPQPTLVWQILSSTYDGASTGRVAPTITGANNNVLNAGNRSGTINLRVSILGTPAIFTDFTVTVAAGRTVVFNLNNGTWPATGLTQTAVGTLATAIDGVQANGVPRRLGHTFNGWWTSATDTATNTGIRVDGSTPLTLFPATGNIQLFARWTASGNTTAVPANSTVATVFPDANLAARVAASLATTFNTTVNASTRVFASDLEQIQTLNLTRGANQPIVDLRGIPTLTGVRTVTPTNGLTSQNITLPGQVRANPLNHTNVVRDRLGAFVVPSTISNSGAIVASTNPANNTIRWTNLPASTTSVTYAWNMQSVLIGNQNVNFSGTATLPIDQAMNFVDVNTNNWFYNAVSFVFNHGYMEGTSTTTFEPNRNLTRAEVAVILYRMAGEPTVTGQVPFTDVTAAWQRNAVIWAASNDVVNGIGNNLFAPNRSVTREEFAAMFHRFAAYSGTNVSIPNTANLDRFPDRAEVSNWAVDYMRWATHTGLIGGTTGGRLNPRGTTTRAECAQIIQRFVTGETAPQAPTPPPTPPTTPPTAPGTVTLTTGTFTVGQDIPAGRYVITGLGHGNFVIRNADNRLHINEILNDMQGTSTQGVPSVTTDLGAGYTIEIRGLQGAVFTPATRSIATTLTTGHWVVGTDVAAGTFYAVPAAGSSGNFIVHNADGRLAYNEILNGRDTGIGVPRVRVNLQNGQTIRVSGLTSVSFTAP